MSKLLVYILTLVLFINAAYHFKIWRRCIYVAKLTRGMTIIILIIPIIFLGLAYTAGNGFVENIIAAIAAILALTFKIIGQGISEEGIYYWTNTGVNRLAKWEEIQKVEINHSRNRLEKIRLSNYASYPNQHYSAEAIQEIEKII